MLVFKQMCTFLKLNETITTLNHEGAVFRQVAYLKLFAIEERVLDTNARK
jgi:hypothetical protein